MGWYRNANLHSELFALRKCYLYGELFGAGTVSCYECFIQLNLELVEAWRHKCNSKNSMIEWLWRLSNFLSSRHDVRARLRWKWENLYCAGYLLFGWEQDFILWAYQWLSVSEYSQFTSALRSLWVQKLLLKSWNSLFPFFKIPVRGTFSLLWFCSGCCGCCWLLVVRTHAITTAKL